MIIFGKRYFGETDSVPGVFRVKTLFFHIDFIPLFPLQSVLIFSLQDELGIPNEMAIKLDEISSKSVYIAWLRFVTSVCTLLSFVFLFLVANIYEGILLVVVAAISGLSAFYFMFGDYFCKATYERATELCNRLGPERAGPILQARVDRYFLQENREFAVVSQVQDDDVEDVNDNEVAVAMPIELELEESPASQQQQKSSSPVVEAIVLT